MARKVGLLPNNSQPSVMQLALSIIYNFRCSGCRLEEAAPADTLGTDEVAKIEASEQHAIDIAGDIHPGVERLWRHFYPNYDRSAFRDQVASHLTPASIILEVGAGSGLGLQNSFDFKGHVARYIGIDIDPRVIANPKLDEAYHADVADLPFRDDTFDVIFHTMVAEHLSDPAAATAELARILKEDGVILFETPNRYYYPMLLAAVTPTWVHNILVRHLGSGRESKDVFPTVYALNDRKSIQRAFELVGMTVHIERHSSPPGYLRFSRASFLLGILYERTIERLFPGLRATLVSTARKT